MRVPGKEAPEFLLDDWPPLGNVSAGATSLVSLRTAQDERSRALAHSLESNHEPFPSSMPP